MNTTIVETPTIVKHHTIELINDTFNQNFKMLKQVEYEDFLSAHRIKKSDNTKRQITNTRIDTLVDSKTQQKRYAGNFEILGKDYETFLNVYYDEVVKNSKEETLTEIQLDNEKAPLLVDIDLQFDYEIQERLFTKTDIEDILKVYLIVLESIHQFSPDDTIEIFVMTKPNINHFVKGEQKYVKDGIHIIIGLQCHHTCQQYIRKRVIDYISSNPPPFWLNHPTKNSLEDVFDRRIPNGDCPWQLYGSKKKSRPEYSQNETYTLTYIYKWNYDMENNEVVQTEIPLKNYDLKVNFKKLSARYENHPPFYTNEFYESQIKEFMNEMDKNKVIDNDKIILPNDEITNSIVKSKIDNSIFKSEYVFELSNIDELDKYIFENFIDNPDMNTTIKEIIEYVLVLPDKYWGNGSYESWIRVGWALYGINEELNVPVELFSIWVKFSSQWSGFCWSDINELYKKWKNFKKDGLSHRSIIYWAKKDSPEKYNEIKKRYNNQYVDDILKNFDSINDSDFAEIAVRINKDRFVCVSLKNKTWYEFKEHRWILNESGVTLRKFIIDDLRILFQNKTFYYQKLLNEAKSNIEEDDDDKNDSKTIKFIKTQIKNLNTIVKKLGNANDIRRILELCADKYYDSEFNNITDTNRDLLCFNNGVIDLKEKVFRQGYPQDYVTKCTNINYIKYEDIPPEHIEILNNFMNSLFPDKELCNYMWEHLASSISGRVHNQTFNYYIGEGSNGKSVLTDLISEGLGDYVSCPSISLITEEDQKGNGPNPNLAALKGIRYCYMQEPSKGKTLKEGLMKQITSGYDQIKTRELYKELFTYQPQLTLVVCANQYLKIDSQDEGTWRRIRAVPFLSKFCLKPNPNNRYEIKIDTEIPEKIKAIKESFVSMLVNKYFETNGIVNDCQMVINKSKEYRNNEDLVSQFIDEYIYEIPTDEIDPSNVKILKQTDVTENFKMFKEISGDTRKYNNKDIFNCISKRFPNSVRYIGKNGKTVQWENLIINDDS